LTSAPTTGSSPRAITAATKIESSVPSDTIASATRPANASTVTIVRTGMTISTRWRGSMMRGR
jgi:endonuclease YncB( thermonuclease family)